MKTLIWGIRLGTLALILTLFPGCGSKPAENKTPESVGTPAGVSRTALWIKNGSTSAVEVGVVLAALGGACGVDHPPVTADTLAALGFCSSVQESGNPPYAGKCMLSLNAGDSIQFPDIPNTCISGNVTFRAYPSCPGGSFPTGFTTAEFTLNPSTGDEVIDISMVNGFSDIVNMSMRGGGSWQVESSDSVVTSIQNKPLGQNIGNPGVYPENCTDCIQLVGSVVCPGFSSSPVCQPSRMCNIQRDVTHNGGRVVITLVPPPTAH